MSALDHKQAFHLLFGMSGLPLKADFLIARRSGHHQAGNSGMAAKGPIADMPRTMGAKTHKCRSFDEWVRAMKINAMPLVEIPVDINHVLILSNPLTSYHRPHSPLAKLFVASWRLVMGTTLGDKVVIVIALLLLAVVAVVSAEFPGIIRAARLVAAL
jgi:hypothetical protein